MQLKTKIVNFNNLKYCNYIFNTYLVGEYFLVDTNNGMYIKSYDKSITYIKLVPFDYDTVQVASIKEGIIDLNLGREVIAGDKFRIYCPDMKSVYYTLL